MVTGSLVVVGTGIRTIGQLTPEARASIEIADRVFYLVCERASEMVLKKLNPRAESLYPFYSDHKPRIQTYREMVEHLLASIRAGNAVCAAFYGHPGVFAYPAHEAVRRARSEGCAARILPGVSAEDCLFADLGIDPGFAGCQSYEATDFLVRQRKWDLSVPLVLWQIGCLGDLGFRSAGYDLSNLRVLADFLCSHYGAQHEVILYEAAIFPLCDPIVQKVPVTAITSANVTAATTLYVPPKLEAQYDDRMARLLGITIDV